jgi:hypothetical protein
MPLEFGSYIVQQEDEPINPSFFSHLVLEIKAWCVVQETQIEMRAA